MWGWAPWVVKRRTEEESWLVLGRRLRLRKVPRLKLPQDPAQLRALISDGFVVRGSANAPQDSVDKHDAMPALNSAHGVVVSAHVPDAAELAASLQALDSRRNWTWATPDQAGTLEPRRERLIVPVLPVEPRPIAMAPLAKTLLAAGRVVWSGESEDGTYIGPVLDGADSATAYDEAVSGWSLDQALDDLGFAGVRPNPMIQLIRDRPDRIARAVLQIAALPSGRCLLIDSDRRVALWNTAGASLDEQTWSHGIVSSLRIRRSAGTTAVFIGSCRTPAGRLAADLECNSGKGLTEEQARLGTCGEAAERFAAWQANRHLAMPAPEAPSFPLRAFHPWGPPWDEPVTSTRMTRAISVHSGAVVNVPACLAPFPFIPLPGETRPTFNDTTGLACHPDRDEAIVRGALEILERHNLYTNLLHERPGARLSPFLLTLPTPLRAYLEDERAWLLTYPDSQPCAPVVHAFARSRDDAFVARGSGSGPCLNLAAQRAIVELLQVNEQFQTGQPSRLGGGHADWSTSSAVKHISHYLDAQPAIDSLSRLPSQLQRLSSSKPAGDLAARFHAFGSDLLTVGLPCPVPHWHTVRMLAPRVVTNQTPSDSEGGRQLQDARFPYQIPT